MVQGRRLSRRRSAEEQAEWETARERVARYHEQELAKLIGHVRTALAALDAGEIDVFEFDEIAHQYKKAAQKLWSFCSGGASDIKRAARILQYEQAEGEIRDWWELAAPRRR